MIEVGDGLFSFCHLTFQEYLTAAHIYTISEKDGSTGLWNNLLDKIDLDRWEETIRLLMASLRSQETRRDVMDRLLDDSEQKNSLTRSSLMLGLLLDALEHDENETDRILFLALNLMAFTREAADFSVLRNRMRTLMRKDPEVIARIEKQAERLLTQTQPNGRVAVPLTAYAVGLSAHATRELLPRSAPRSVSECWLRTLLGEVRKTRPKLLEEDLRSLTDILPGLTLQLAPTWVAVILGLFAPIGPAFLERLALRCMLAAWRTAGIPERTAFYYFGDNIYFFGLCAFDLWPPFIDQHTRLAAQKGPDWERMRPMGRVQERLQLRPFDALAKEVANKQTGRLRLPSNWQSGFEILGKSLSDANQRYRNQPLKDVLAGTWDERARGALADWISQFLGLTPALQWNELLLAYFEPHGHPLPIFDRNRLAETLAGRLTPDTLELAALLLLLDGWMWLKGVWQDRQESVLVGLPEMVRAHNAAPLRLASCLRDIAYGDESRGPELCDLVSDPDPEMAQLLDEGYWKRP
jgi:hypothetical protein